MEESLRCIPNIGYFGSIDFITFALHTITFLSLPIHIFGLFLIIAKSQNDLASAKWSLFHCHVATSFFNVTVTLLIQPFLLLPAMAGVSNGVLQSVGVNQEIEFNTLMIGLALIVLSHLSLIESRFTLIFTKADCFWRKFRRFWKLLHYSGVLGLLILAIYSLPDQEEARQIVYKVGFLSVITQKPILPEPSLPPRFLTFFSFCLSSLLISYHYHLHHFHTNNHC